MCRVCTITHEGNHWCEKCGHRTHIWCGVPVAEGYGQPVTCNLCLKETNKKGNANNIVSIHP